MDPLIWYSNMSTTGPTSIGETLRVRAFIENLLMNRKLSAEGRRLCDSVVDAIGDDLASLRAENLRLQDKLDRLKETADEFRQVGDTLQSEASRVAEWARGSTGLPYEVYMALLGVEHSVVAWTEVRRGENRS